MDENVAELKLEILKCVMSYHRSGKPIPSVRALCRRFGLTNRRFYSMFSEGQKGICRELGIPAPARSANTIAANETRTNKGGLVSLLDGLNRLVLTEEQTSRFNAIAHIDGQSQSAAVDAVLGRDAALRRLLNDVANAPRVAGFLEEAVRKGWTAAGLVNSLTSLESLGLLHTNGDSARRLIAVTEDLFRRNWNLGSFVQIATRHVNAIYWEREYLNGTITLSQLEARVQSV